jgi:hypothetical protein
MPPLSHRSPRSTLSPLLALLLVVPVPSLAVLAGMVWWPGTTLGQSLFLLGKCWVLVLPLAWHLAVDRLPCSWSPPWRGGLRIGLLSGLAIAAAIIVAFLAAKPHIDTAGFRAVLTQAGIDGPGTYIALAAYWTFINALVEEYLWRWFVAGRAARLLPRAAAVALAAAAFGAHHLIALGCYLPWPLAALATLGVVIGGAWWSWLYLRYESVWPGYVSHVCADVAVFAAGGVLLFG